ncbi:MAG TPA: porin family protein [Gemmatimonadaceae bacterium]|nr:porin family protein [Gemmatimonadaceae bacterium]
MTSPGSLWLAALLLVSAVTLPAQTPVQIGVAGGVAINDVVGDDTEGAESRTTGYFGGVLVWQPAGMVGFETGIYYVPKGAEFNEDGVNGTIKLNYVEVPLLLRLALPISQSPIRPVLTIGGAVAFKSSCDVEGEGGGVSVEIDCDEFFTLLEDEVGVKAEMQSVDYGVVAGLAVDFPAGERMVISPSIRYVRGLRDILEIGGTSVDARNAGFQVGIALRLGI